MTTPKKILPQQAPRIPVTHMDVHLWCAPTAILVDASLVALYRRLLTPDEERRYQSYTVARARDQYLLTRALVRSVLSTHGGLAPEAWRFRTNRHGRPEIDGDSELRFNLSNCEGLVVCAVTIGADVGVDVEARSSAVRIAEVAPRVFSGEELATLSALPAAAREDRALSLWVVKEAYLKARGTGLVEHVRAITVSIDGDDVRLRADPRATDLDTWRFAMLDFDDHRVALAIGRPDLHVHVWRTVPLVRGDAEP